MNSTLPSLLLLATPTQSSNSSMRMAISEFSRRSISAFSLLSLSMILTMARWRNGSFNSSLMLSRGNHALTAQTRLLDPLQSFFRYQVAQKIEILIRIHIGSVLPTLLLRCLSSSNAFSWRCALRLVTDSHPHPPLCEL